MAKAFNQAYRLYVQYKTTGAKYQMLAAMFECTPPEMNALMSAEAYRRSRAKHST